MYQFAPLGIFLILAFILPGMIITFTLMMLFPELSSLFPTTGGIEFIGIVLVIAFINGHPAFLFELYILDPIWNKIFPYWYLKKRRNFILNRSKIIANAEIKGLTHNHYDQTLGEFILFNNTAFWLFLIAGVRLFNSPSKKIFLMSIVIFLASVISLLFVSPFFKKSYIDILETLQREIQSKNKLNI